MHVSLSRDTLDLKYIIKLKYKNAAEALTFVCVYEIIFSELDQDSLLVYHFNEFVDNWYWCSGCYKYNKVYL